MERRIEPDVPAVLKAAAGGPDRFVLAIHEALEPVFAPLARRLEAPDLDALRWVAMELAANAMLAPMGRVLVQRTGCARGALLDALAVNPLWGPGGAGPPAFDRGDETIRRIEAAVGRSVAGFLALPLVERFSALGLPDPAHPLEVVVRAPEQGFAFALHVGDSSPLTAGDRAQIARRFEDPHGVRAEVDVLRRPFAAGDGSFRIPSFTGGGGAGLLACLRVCRERGWTLAFLDGQEGRPGAWFRVRGADFPGGKDAAKSASVRSPR